MMPMSIAHRRDHQGPSSTAQTILMRCAIGHIPSMRRMGEITTPTATNIAKNTCLSKCSRLNPLFCMMIPHKQPKISFRHIRRKIRTGTTISCGPAAACELKTGQQQAGAMACLFLSVLAGQRHCSTEIRDCIRRKRTYIVRLLCRMHDLFLLQYLCGRQSILPSHPETRAPSLFHLRSV